ncbi:MAG: anaerobic glycerol-3-phosphate dehydrogenase subunit C [Planctomycetota bacterium]|nr:anaerobic glycerol-3-phosphate dehydrogenase subunit C [Planctomycetota bacterium]
MDPERERIRADLLGVITGDVLVDDLSLQLYASDASIFEHRPAAVVRPRSTKDVSACLKYATEHGLSVHPRGAGSGVAGESLGQGLVLDFTCYMRRILREEEESIPVQPGMVLAQLNRYLSNSGRFFGPDPSTRSVTSMGSVAALDASGSHWLRYGSARRYIESLQCVLASGEVMELGKQSLAGIGSRLDGEPDLRWHLGQKVAGIIHKNRDQLQKSQCRTKVNRVGYQLEDLQDANSIDLAKLLVGSEGTLGVITEMTVKTTPRPKQRGVVLFFFEHLETAALAAVDIAKLGADACDLMDRRLLSIAREKDSEYSRVIPPDAEGMLLVEFQDENHVDLHKQLKDLVQKIKRRYKEPFDYHITLETDQRNRFWKLARRVIPTLYRLKGSQRAIPFIEDIAVPPEALSGFLTSAQNILKQQQITASIFAHAGHGQLHIRPFVDLADPKVGNVLHRLSEKLYTETLAVGGTISGEHGLGLSRSWYAKQQLGPAYHVMRQIKRTFDPQLILNPGNIFTEAIEPPRRQIRRVSSQIDFRTEEDTPKKEPEAAKNAQGPSLPVIDLNLNWKDVDITTTARACNGCGRCRTHGTEERMCPIFRVDTREESSPRAKANLMRAIATGAIPSELLQSEELKQTADLCVNCHQCRIDCPASVDIPKLMMEAKSQYVDQNGFTLSDWFLARIDLFFAIGSRFHSATNWMAEKRWVRWLLEKTLGIAQVRPFPRFEKRSFIRQAAKQGLGVPSRRQGRRVVYFVDTFANWCDTELAWSVVKVLEHQGIDVYVPSKQLPSGMSLVSCGAIERARNLAQANIELLAECVRQGYDIVTSEPAATLCLKHEYLNLLDDSDARLVAGKTYDISEYLLRLKREEKLELSFKPLNHTIGYHLPCHQRALFEKSPSLELLSLISGLQVQPIEKGCSGMAGTWGMKKKNYLQSIRMGWGLMSELRKPDYFVGTTECTACKMQMEHAARKPTLHPVKILAMAYGLLGEDRKFLRSHGDRR